MTIEQGLIDYFRESGEFEVHLDTKLMEEGIIDSMGVMQLVSFIEKTYSIEVDMDDLTMDNFATIARIMNLISTKKGKV